MNVGDIVTIKWPGDIIAIRVPQGVGPGDKVRVKLGELLEIVEEPPDIEIEQVAPVSAVAVSDTTPVAPAYQGKGRRGGQSECKKCGGHVFWFQSRRTGRWYTCDSSNPTDFHSRTCTQRQQQKAVNGTASQAATP